LAKGAFQSLGLFAPEALGVVHAARIQGSILLEAVDVRPFLEGLRRVENAAFLLDRLDVWHASTPSEGACYDLNG
jgi:hypothetical protein